MAKYKVLQPLVWGTRREVGEIIEISDDDARALGDTYVAPEPEPATAGAKVEGEVAVKPKGYRRKKK